MTTYKGNLPWSAVADGLKLSDDELRTLLVAVGLESPEGFSVTIDGVTHSPIFGLMMRLDAYLRGEAPAPLTYGDAFVLQTCLRRIGSISSQSDAFPTAPRDALLVKLEHVLRDGGVAMVEAV